jgi:epoxide hydrolase-like predicted phosphatase
VIKALIFDYFDVIRPTGSGIRPTYRKLGGDVEKDEVFIDDVTSAGGYGFIDDMNQQLASRLGVSLEMWLEAVAGSDKNDPDLLMYIEQLRKQGLKIGLLSNAGPGSLDIFFAPGELEHYFDAALISGDTGFLKPEAAFYRMMAERLGVKPQDCVMIDDRIEFCKGAEFVGMQSIQYRHFDQFKKDLTKLLATT